MDQAEFQQKQSAIYPDLAGAVIDCIPDDWDEALLTLGPPVTDGDVETMSHELTNPQLTSGLNAVLPDEAVFAQTRRLEMLFREFGAKWAKAMLRVTWDEAADQWRMVMEYEYDK